MYSLSNVLNYLQGRKMETGGLWWFDAMKMFVIVNTWFGHVKKSWTCHTPLKTEMKPGNTPLEKEQKYEPSIVGVHVGLFDFWQEE